MGSMKDLLGDELYVPRERPPIAYKETSRQALNSFAPVSGDLDAKIVAVIRASGSSGITCEAVEQQIGRTHQAVSGNLRHLVEREVVKDSGLKGKTASGRTAIRWVIA